MIRSDVHPAPPASTPFPLPTPFRRVGEAAATVAVTAVGSAMLAFAFVAAAFTPRPRDAV